MQGLSIRSPCVGQYVFYVYHRRPHKCQIPPHALSAFPPLSRHATKAKVPHTARKLARCRYNLPHYCVFDLYVVTVQGLNLLAALATFGPAMAYTHAISVRMLSIFVYTSYSVRYILHHLSIPLPLLINSIILYVMASE